LQPIQRGLQRVVGRYAIFDEIASGGMATVHFGRLLGPVGFTRTVAIKRLHPQFAKDPEFVAMFLDEARLAARIRHMNVVPTLDVVAIAGELFLVMDYVQGESLSRLWRAAGADGQGGLMPVPVAVGILSGVLRGLHAAHEAKNERGEPLGIVHRDVSPHNVLVGVDGIARLLDFGVAKAVGRAHTTREGQIKGKIAYMAPEYLSAQPIDRRSDVYAAGVILWQCLTGRRLFEGDNEVQLLARVAEGRTSPPSSVVAAIAPELDEVVMRSLARNPADRFQTARAMAMAIEQCVRPATPTEVGEWVESLASNSLLRRAERMAEIESLTSTQVVPENTSTRALDAPDAVGMAPLFGELPTFSDAFVTSPGAAPGAAPQGAPPSAQPSLTASQIAAAQAPGSRPGAAPESTQSQLSLLSSVSRVSNAPPGLDARQRRRKVALGLLTVVMSIGCGVIVAGLVGTKPPPTPAPVPALGAASQSVPAALAPPSPAVAAPEPVVAPPPSDTPPAATASAAPKVVAPPKPPPPPPRVTPPPPPAPPRRTTSPTQGDAGNCTPPYTVDASGIRRMKPQCI
jgi:eukaryotic-like serine/threonine-protein kinase